MALHRCGDGGRVRVGGGGIHGWMAAVGRTAPRQYTGCVQRYQTCRSVHEELLGWLRREARSDEWSRGLCTAAFTLAKAG